MSVGDNTFTNSGYVMLSAVNLSTKNVIYGEFDNVVVSEPFPNTFQATTWAAIKETL